MTGRRLRVGVLVAVVALLGLAGCAQDNTPDAYDTLTQQNFLELCTNTYFENTDDTLSQTSNTIAAGVQALDVTKCQCQYDVFVEKMPINKSATPPPGYSGPNFTDLNASLKSNPTEAWATVPESIKTALTACASGSSGTTTTTAPATTTTTN